LIPFDFCKGFLKSWKKLGVSTSFNNGMLDAKRCKTRVQQDLQEQNQKLMSTWRINQTKNDKKMASNISPVSQ